MIRVILASMVYLHVRVLISAHARSNAIFVRLLFDNTVNAYCFM